MCHYSLCFTFIHFNKQFRHFRAFDSHSIWYVKFVNLIWYLNRLQLIRWIFSTVWLFSDFLRYGNESLIECKITTFVRNHWPNARQSVLFFIVLSSSSFAYRYSTSGISVSDENNTLDSALLFTLILLFNLAIGIWFQLSFQIQIHMLT